MINASIVIHLQNRKMNDYTGINHLQNRKIIDYICINVAGISFLILYFSKTSDETQNKFLELRDTSSWIICKYQQCVLSKTIKK